MKFGSIAESLDEIREKVTALGNAHDNTVDAYNTNFKCLADYYNGLNAVVDHLREEMDMYDDFCDNMQGQLMEMENKLRRSRRVIRFLGFFGTCGTIAAIGRINSSTSGISIR